VGRRRTHGCTTEGRRPTGPRSAGAQAAGRYIASRPHPLTTRMRAGRGCRYVPPDRSAWGSATADWPSGGVRPRRSTSATDQCRATRAMSRHERVERGSRVVDAGGPQHGPEPPGDVGPERGEARVRRRVRRAALGAGVSGTDARRPPGRIGWGVGEHVGSNLTAPGAYGRVRLPFDPAIAPEGTASSRLPRHPSMPSRAGYVAGHRWAARPTRNPPVRRSAGGPTQGQRGAWSHVARGWGGPAACRLPAHARPRPSRPRHP
jgi:hypothetical protein